MLRSSARRPASWEALGALLIVVGVAVAIVQWTSLRIDHLAWPLFILVPGLALQTLALFAPRPMGTGLSVAGGMTTIAGAVLLFQNGTGLWDTWAYAWALVVPGGAGLGLIGQGLAEGDREMARAGTTALFAGLVLFVGGGAFFESVLHLSGPSLGAMRGVFPALLIAIGIVFLGSRLVAKETDDAR